MDHPEYTLTLPPACPRNQERLKYPLRSVGPFLPQAHLPDFESLCNVYLSISVSILLAVGGYVGSLDCGTRTSLQQTRVC